MLKKFIEILAEDNTKAIESFIEEMGWDEGQAGAKEKMTLELTKNFIVIKKGKR